MFTPFSITPSIKVRDMKLLISLMLINFALALQVTSKHTAYITSLINENNDRKYNMNLAY